MKKEIRYPTPVLCLVHYGRCYFTTRDLQEQWGDDWNDAPYEHNCGEPYDYHEYDRKKGIEPWEVVSFSFSGEFREPRHPHHNSPYSVQMINDGEIPWLVSEQHADTKKVIIPAGTPICDTIKMIWAGGGEVGVNPGNSAWAYIKESLN